MIGVVCDNSGRMGNLHLFFLLLGFYIVLAGLAYVPIVAAHFSLILSGKRCFVLVVATGLLFILMEPPIPLSWTYFSNLIKAA